MSTKQISRLVVLVAVVISLVAIVIWMFAYSKKMRKK